MKKDEIICVVINSLTDSADDINLENPYTYSSRILTYRVSDETKEVYMQKVSVESLMNEKEKEAVIEADIQGCRITSFAEFLGKKFGYDKIYLLACNEAVDIAVKDQNLTREH